MAKRPKLTNYHENFVEREILDAMSRNAQQHGGKVIIKEVHQLLLRRGWDISYSTVRRYVHRLIKGTGWKIKYQTKR